MKQQTRFSRGVSGFTLVEVLVSLTVLSLIVFLVSSITNSATQTVALGNQRLSSSSEARVVFNRMAVDFGNMIRREDVDAVFKSDDFPQGTGLVGVNDQFAFYSNVKGGLNISPPYPSNSEISSTSLVAYKLATNATNYPNEPVLQRMSMALGWKRGTNYLAMAYLPVIITNPPGVSSGGAPELISGLLPNPNSPSATSTQEDYFQVIGDQVFRMEYTYLLKKRPTDPAGFQTFSTNPWRTTSPSTIRGLKDVAAVIVALGVIDRDARARITDYNQLVSALPNAVSGADVMSQWMSIVNAQDFAEDAGITQKAVSSVKLYQRYFYLDNQ